MSMLYLRNKPIGAISRGVDNGSVSVTADGVKTYATLLNELYALIDMGKVTMNTALVRYISNTTLVYHLRYATSNMLIVDFAGIDVSSVNNIATQTFTLMSSGSNYKVMNGGSYSDNSSAVPASGTTFTLYY